MCLACQHFDFNSADWISDNLHVISRQYLRAGRRDEPLRTSAWETTLYRDFGSFLNEKKKTMVGDKMIPGHMDKDNKKLEQAILTGVASINYYTRLLAPYYNMFDLFDFIPGLCV